MATDFKLKQAKLVGVYFIQHFDNNIHVTKSCALPLNIGQYR